MNIPKVSVVITCYNYSEYVIEALESVLCQTLKDFECIIVDDGSTDDSKAIICDWIKKDLRFSYHYQDNAGVSSARNKAITLSNSKYILPLDADDKISPNYLEDCFQVINFNSKVKLVYGKSYILNNPKKSWNLGIYEFDDLLYKNMIHCSAVFKREDWEEIGGFDNNLKKGLEDWEFWINLLKNGGDVIEIDSCQFYYRIKESSLNQSVIKNDYGYDSRLYIFNKHIEKYIKTNAYDMYFENYNLKRKLENPLVFLSTKKLFLLFLESVFLKTLFFIKKIKKKLNFNIFF